MENKSIDYRLFAHPKPERKKKTKKKKRKLLKIPKLKTKAFRYFSRYVRLEHAIDGMVECITCGKWVDAIHEAEAGHFKHGKSLECYFDKRNVHPQCTSCNHFHKTIAAQKYALFMVMKYGPKVVEDLLESKKVIWKRDFLEGIIRTYQQKLKELEGG